jgi:hypothetical protein
VVRDHRRDRDQWHGDEQRQQECDRLQPVDAQPAAPIAAITAR